MTIVNAPYDPLDSLVRINQTLGFAYDDNPQIEIPIGVKLLNNKITRTFATVICVSFSMPKSSAEFALMGRVIRAFTNECVHLFMSTDLCRDIIVQNRSIVGVFSTPTKDDIVSLMRLSAQTNSLRDMINSKLNEFYENVDLRIESSAAVDYGKIYAVTLDDDEIVWRGSPLFRVIKRAEEYIPKNCVFITSVVYQNLSNTYKEYFSKSPISENDCVVGYTSKFYNVTMKQLISK